MVCAPRLYHTITIEIFIFTQHSKKVSTESCENAKPACVLPLVCYVSTPAVSNYYSFNFLDLLIAPTSNPAHTSVVFCLLRFMLALIRFATPETTSSAIRNTLTTHFVMACNFRWHFHPSAIEFFPQLQLHYLRGINFKLGSYVPNKRILAKCDK